MKGKKYLLSLLLMALPANSSTTLHRHHHQVPEPSPLVNSYVPEQSDSEDDWLLSDSPVSLGESSMSCSLSDTISSTPLDSTIGSHSSTATSSSASADSSSQLSSESFDENDVTPVTPKAQRTNHDLPSEPGFKTPENNRILVKESPKPKVFSKELIERNLDPNADYFWRLFGEVPQTISPATFEVARDLAYAMLSQSIPSFDEIQEIVNSLLALAKSEGYASQPLPEDEELASMIDEAIREDYKELIKIFDEGLDKPDLEPKVELLTRLENIDNVLRDLGFNGIVDPLRQSSITDLALDLRGQCAFMRWTFDLKKWFSLSDDIEKLTTNILKLYTLHRERSIQIPSTIDDDIWGNY